MFSANLNVPDQARLSNQLDIHMASHLGRYLDCPTHHERPSRSSFQNTIGKIQEKVTGWKIKCLSMAGRATLIKDVNTTMPAAHIMQSNYLPKSVTQILDKLNRDFLWGSSPEAKKVHVVSWIEFPNRKVSGVSSRQSWLTEFLWLN